MEIAHLAAHTSDIRVGSGTVLLNHYSPFKVAETFSTLDALAPGRIDLGLGRATGLPAADRALQSGQIPQQSNEDHARKIEETARHLYGAFPEEHPYSTIKIPRSEEAIPEVWVLGSSPNSAAIAGELGLPYAFAAFIRPTVAKSALETYRDRFQASPFDEGLESPYSMLAVNIACADTDEAAARLRASSEAAYRRMRRGAYGPPPTVEEAIRELGGVPEPTSPSLDPHKWPRALSGSPSTIRTLLEHMTDAVDADEVIIQNLIENPEARLRSHELIADSMDLSSQ